MPTFADIKQECTQSGTLWEDPDFPATYDSIMPDSYDDDAYIWMRPKEISDAPPKFIIEGTSRFDLAQGEIADCWFISSAAVLATKPDIFAQVVPPDQGFDDGYIGAFRFCFWQYGEWKEVVVDDRLPVTSGTKELIFGMNRGQPNEFWGPLLEKAYAKLYGFYYAISQGHIREAMVDFTGGLSEVYNLSKPERLPADFFDIIKRSFNNGSLMGAAIWNPKGKTIEEEQMSGLFKGHAYSVTGVLETDIGGSPTRLLRFKNPWGKSEWNGAWSDGSAEWSAVSEEEKKKIDLIVQDDGEFWMSFEDMKTNFSMLDIVHLGPSTFARLDTPKEMSKKQPKFIVEGATRFDLGQGELGDCWFIASAAVLATKPNLFAQVVPVEQSFVTNYVGAFRFNFWHFGEWKEVVVDDRLPVNEDGQLIYCRNRTQPSEFWGPLLEKAYAKLYGCYYAIANGHVRDALVDLTGGISEMYNLRREDGVPDDLFDIIHTSYLNGSLSGALIWNATGNTQEEEMWNGLYKGHIYSITSVLETRIQGWPMKLIRMRNPWGKGEWTGPWSDKSDEWKSVPEDQRKEVNLVVEDDGEFWITFEDVLKNFSMLDIVHLGPSTFARLPVPKESITWHEIQHHGRWVKGVNAGGNGLVSSLELYYRNPQYFVTLKEPDKDAMNITGECSMIVSLLLKDYRQRKFSRALKKLIVGFDVHLLRSGKPELMDSVSFEERTIMKKKYSTRTVVREVTTRLSLDPGTYVIIPRTFRADQEAPYLLRVFTYSHADTIEIQEPTGPISTEDVPKGQARPVGMISADLFAEFAEDDLVIDARDLRDLLNILFKKDFGQTLTFSVEACRTLISIADAGEGGVLDFEQTAKVWDDILYWKKLFHKYDKDQAGAMETWELRKAFKAIGFSISYPTLKTIAIRYGGKDRTLFFEDFVLCLAKTIAMYNAFNEFNKDSEGDATVDLEKWLRTTLLY